MNDVVSREDEDKDKDEDEDEARTSHVFKVVAVVVNFQFSIEFSSHASHT